MDFDLLSRELLRAVRGTMSQSALTRRLGYSGKQVHRWESGERKISWLAFHEVCRERNINLASALKRGLRIQCSPTNTAQLVTRLIGGARLVALQNDSGFSRFSLMRWKCGKSVPSLAEVLRLIDACQFQLFEFLEQLVELKTIGSLAAEYELKQMKKSLYFQFPQAVAVVACLLLDDYKRLKRHPDGYVSEKLGISEAEEKEILKQLVKVGRIFKRGGKYFPSLDAVDLMSKDRDGKRHFLNYWVNRLAEFLNDADEAVEASSLSRFGMEIFAVNEESKSLLAEEYRSFQQRIRSLMTLEARGDKPRDEVVILHWLFYDPTDAKPRRALSGSS